MREIRAVLAGGAALALGAALLAAAAEVALRRRYGRRALPRVAAAPGQVTVAALGDSIVAGAPRAIGAAWPELLAEQLRAAYPAVAWRVVNAGQSGNTAPQGYARFEADVAAAGPQLVLIAFGLNDCNRARRSMDPWLEGAVPRNRWRRRSYVWRAVRARIERLRRPAALPGPAAEEERLPVPRTSPAGFAATLEALLRRTQEIGAQAALLTMTPLAAADTEGVRARAETYAGYNAAVRELAAAWAVPLVELAAGAPADTLEPDGFHLNAAGQAWAAGQVYRQLAAANVWRELATFRRLPTLEA